MRFLKQYQKLLALDEVKLEFEDGRASCHCSEGTGERYRCQSIYVQSWRSTCWISCMRFRRMTVLAEVVITREYIEGNGGPRLSASWTGTGTYRKGIII